MQKAKREVNGKETANARIRINYKNKKPKVKFSYPDKKNQASGSMFPFILMGWILINLPIILSIGIMNTSTEDFKDINNYNDWIEYKTSEEYLKETYEIYAHPIKVILKDFWGGLLRALIGIAYIFGVPCLIYFPFRERWNKRFPDFMAWMASKKYKKFTTKDLIYNNKDIYLELPIFNNVICDFKATKDFSKHLIEFEIEEYKFKSFSKSKQKDGTRKRTFNEKLWYARWYFKEQPKKGFVEVIFK